MRSPSRKASKFFGEPSTALVVDQILTSGNLDRQYSAQQQQQQCNDQQATRLQRTKRTDPLQRSHIESKNVLLSSPKQFLPSVNADQCARVYLTSQFDAIKERPTESSRSMKHIVDIQQSAGLGISPLYSLSTSSSSSLSSFVSHPHAQTSDSTLISSKPAYMRGSISFTSPSDAFPCRRIDKCKWSLLDETVSKYEEQKLVMGKKRKSWKSRRITVNSRLDDCESNQTKSQACLHSFKRSDMDTLENERLILTESSYAAVVESSKEYGGGKWVIKVHGTVLSGAKTASEEANPKKERQAGDWLLQFPHFERMQVWLKHLKLLIDRLQEIEYAFRVGHSPSRPITAMSCRKFENRGQDTDYEKHHGEDTEGYLSDSVEELAKSTESLPFKLLFPPRRESLSSTTSKQASPHSKGKQSCDSESVRRKVRRSSSSRLALNSPNNNNLRSSNDQDSVSSVTLHTSLRASYTLQVAIPSTPLQMTTPSFSPSTSKSEENTCEWDSPSSSSSTQWQSSLSSPVVSVDTRSSFSSQSSPKTPINHFSLIGHSTRKRKEVALRLEGESLRPAIISRLSLDPCLLDSPTDPDTELAPVSLSQQHDNKSGLLPNLVKEKQSIVAYQPRSYSYDSQIGLAL